MIPADAIEVRAYRPSEDKAFLYSTWLKCYKYSSYFAKRVRPHVFFRGHQAVLDHLSKKPSFKVYIACPKSDPETILGYLACETEPAHVLHFVFVKDAFRKMGIAKRLFQAAGLEIKSLSFTHWTTPVDEFFSRWPETTYDPYAL